MIRGDTMVDGTGCSARAVSAGRLRFSLVVVLLLLDLLFDVEPHERRGESGEAAAASAPSAPAEESGPSAGAAGEAAADGAPVREAPAKEAVATPPVASPPAGEPPARVPARRVIEEIVVTAQKQEQNLRDVPISVSVLDSEFMTEQSITDFRDVALYTANFRVNDSSNVPQPDLRIRGFGTARANRAFEQAVGLTVDGDTFGQQEFFRGALFDIDRVEVLKGPQGTFFGKNTTAGLVNLVPKNPTDELEGFIDLQGGELNRRRVEAAVGGPLVARFVNFRIAGVTDKQDGYVKNTTARTVPGADDPLGNRERNGLRAKLGFPSLWGTSLLLTAEHSESDFFGVPAEIVEAEPQAMRDLLKKYDPNVDLIEGNYVGSVDFPSAGRRKIRRFAANASTDWGGWGLNAVIGHSHLDAFDAADVDATPIPIGQATSHDGSTQTTFELRASSPSLPGFFGVGQFLGLDLGRTEFTAGLFHQRRHYTTHTGLFLNFVAIGEQTAAAMGVEPSPFPSGAQHPDGPEQTFSDFSQEARSYAGFGQMRWHPFERWTLEAGIRLTYETKDAHIVRTFDSPQSEALYNQVTNFFAFNVHLSRAEPAFTPKVALIYDLTDDVNVYGSWAIGFKSGGFNENGTTPSGLTFKTERMKAWELGTKTRLLGGTAMLNFGLFWMNVTDLQVYTFEPPPPGKLSGPILTTNAGAGRSRGFEADATWLPTSWLTLRDSLGFVDSKYLDFKIGSCEAGAPNTDGDSDPRCDQTGKPFEFTPKWVNSLTGSVRLPLEWLARRGLPLQGVDLLGGLTVHYVDNYFASESLNPLTRQPSYFKFDAHLGLGNLGKGWSVMVTGQNLTDKLTYTTRRRLVTGGLTSAFDEPPRQIFGSLRWAF